MSPDPADPRPIVNLAGRLVGLGPIDRRWLSLYQRWLNDFEVTRTLAIGNHPVTLEAEGEWYDRAWRSTDSFTFTIYDLASGRPIGLTDLRRIDDRERTAEFGILIGEKEFWGRGYGTEATSLLLDFAFDSLGLHNVLLIVFADNTRAIRAYERAGFRIVGRRRESHRPGGRAVDEVLMDCLSTDPRPDRA